MLRSLFTLAVVFAAMTGCRESAPPAVPLDVAESPSGARLSDANGAPGATGTTPKAAPTTCRAKLVAGRIRKGASCFLDERISHGAGTLTYPCAGTGSVEATFGEHRYTGRAEQGTFTIETTSELDWQDGCHWTAHQTIHGNPAERELAWSYEESAVGASTCASPCDGSADIAVRPSDDED